MSKLFINCRKATYLHEQNKEAKLSASERFALWLHLQFCGLCKKFVKQVEEVEKVCGKVSANADMQMSEAAKERIQQELQNERQ